MLSTMLFLLGTTAALPAQDAAHPAQSVNGGEPQRMDAAAPRTTQREEHWTDGMNTKRAPDPRKRDEYGAPKVSPPTGQGTDNPGGIPGPRKHPPRPKNGDQEERQSRPGSN